MFLCGERGKHLCSAFLLLYIEMGPFIMTVLGGPSWLLFGKLPPHSVASGWRHKSWRSSVVQIHYAWLATWLPQFNADFMFCYHSICLQNLCFTFSLGLPTYPPQLVDIINNYYSLRSLLYKKYGQPLASTNGRIARYSQGRGRGSFSLLTSKDIFFKLENYFSAIWHVFL